MLCLKTILNQLSRRKTVQFMKQVFFVFCEKGGLAREQVDATVTLRDA